MHVHEPNYDQVFATAGVNFLEQERFRFMHDDSVYHSLANQHKSSPVYDSLYQRIAHTVEPVDPILGFDRKTPLSHAFLRGSFPALHVVDRFLTHDFQLGMQARAVMEYGCDPLLLPKDSARRAPLQHALGAAVVDAGERGWRAADMYQHLVESMFENIEEGIDARIAAQRGFGFVMKLVVDTREQRIADDVKELDEVLATKINVTDDPSTGFADDVIDWDVAYKTMTAGQEAPVTLEEEQGE